MLHGSLLSRRRLSDYLLSRCNLFSRSFLRRRLLGNVLHRSFLRRRLRGNLLHRCFTRCFYWSFLGRGLRDNLLRKGFRRSLGNRLRLNRSSHCLSRSSGLNRSRSLLGSSFGRSSRSLSLGSILRSHPRTRLTLARSCHSLQLLTIRLDRSL